MFVLLETGSSPVTRSAAARQLGEVQKLHPHELNTLLTRLATYLKSSIWETRVAASEAVCAIVRNVPDWNPEGINNGKGGSFACLALFISSNLFIVLAEEDGHSNSLSTIGRLRFQQFEMEKVLANSTHLMASEGKEYDIEEDSTLGRICYL